METNSRYFFAKKEFLGNMKDTISNWMNTDFCDYLKIEIGGQTFEAGEYLQNKDYDLFEDSLYVSFEGILKIHCFVLEGSKDLEEFNKRFKIFVESVYHYIDKDFIAFYGKETEWLKENKRLKSQLAFCQYSSKTDFRTNCYNEGFCQEVIDDHINTNKEFGIAFFKVRSFFRLNIKYGQMEGDKILLEFTNFLNECLGNLGDVYRFNGDTLALIGYNINEKLYKEIRLKMTALVQNSLLKDYSFDSGYAKYKGQAKSEYLLEIFDNMI